MLLFSVHPKPKGRKVKKMNFVTLKELKKMVPAVEERKRPPSLKKILEEGTEVLLRKLMENHAEVVVYKNGYVSYQAHERSTVFPIHDCKHYHYESQGNEQQTIPKMQQLNEQQFKGLELEWYKPEEPNKKTGVAEK